MRADPIIIIQEKQSFQSVNSFDVAEEEMQDLPSGRKKQEIPNQTYARKKISTDTLCLALLIILIIAVLGIIIKEISLKRQQIQNQKNTNLIQNRKQNKPIEYLFPNKDFIQKIDNSSGLAKQNISQPILDPTSLDLTSQNKTNSSPSDKIDDNIPSKTIQVGQLPPSKPSSSKKPYIPQNSHTPFTEHSHLQYQFTYQTMGMRSAKTFFNFTEVSPNQYYQYESKMVQLFKPFNDTDCQLQRYGDSGDGGYLLCKNFVNKSVALINLGVEGRDMFGCQLTSQFRMPNYQYDCTQNTRTVCSTNNNGNEFQLGCMGQVQQKENGLQYYSLKDIVDIRKLTNKHVIMKIDIQGAEWPGFRTFPIKYLDYVDQFIIEFHNPAPNIRQTAFWGNIDIIESLKQKFVSVNLHSNTGSCYYSNKEQHKLPAFALEVSLVNKKIINIKSPSRSYVLNSKNSLNGGGIDCQMND